MNSFFWKSGTLYLFVILSLIGHSLCGLLLGGVGPFELSAPVSPLAAIVVTLKEPDAGPQPSTAKGEDDINLARREPSNPGIASAERGYDPVTATTSRRELADESAPAREAAQISSQSTVEEKGSDVPADVAGKAIAENEVAEYPDAVSVPVSLDYNRNKGPVRRADEFLATKREKLTYRISLLKMPAGTAVVDAINNDGELKISVKITSNAVLSAIYPVDDLVETRMIKGNYLLTRVRQKEGSYRGDFGFTLMLLEHKAFWVDRVAGRYDYQPLPAADVMDAVSGFYFLRNQELEVGKDVLLHLFDSNQYSPTTVEVLRRERISLPGSREVNTLVLHPLFKTAGFFRRTGDMIIWLTDDEFKVPVRLETTIPLGKVTAELISAEVEKSTSPPHTLSLSLR